jgi:serine/threonine protein kinase
MAPEMIRGEEYTQAVDYWAFGVLIYEALVGKLPFGIHEEKSIDDVY